MNLRNLLLAATVLAAPIVIASGSANAQPVNGIYVGGALGYNYAMSQDVINGYSAGAKTSLSGSGGPAVSASVGYGFGNGLRVELEGNYLAQHDKIKQGTPYTGGADMQTFGPMFNALYDFDAGLGWMYPFVGAGIGYEFANNRGLHANDARTNFSSSNQTKGGLAVQGILGAGFPIPGAPGLSITAEYRFLALLSSPTFNGTYTNAAGVNSAGSMKLASQYNHAGLIGVRYAFGVAPAAATPAPAPVAAPAPAPARTYLVFFDWDKADLTARARQIIAEAAQASTRVAVTKIEVSGHADRTGTAAYNQTLSLKRANNVAAELVRLGVPKASIGIQGFGDTKPLVPTAAGVREPQNRRVEIVLK
jgi:outer membrane protein OmpA-like peptidoglycan-associated protein